MIKLEYRQDPTAVERILRALPDWFGIEVAIVGYVDDAATKSSLLAVADDDTVVGVALIEVHHPQAAELFLIAVHPDYRGRGIGRALTARVETDLRDQGVRLLQVKTVGDSSEDKAYAETRAFYRARGFLPLEEIHSLCWPGPTVIMVKVLAP